VSAQSTEKRRRPAIPIGPFVREQILARLRTALRIAETGLAERFDAFRAAIGEVSERADAIELTARFSPPEQDESSRPASRLPFAALGQSPAAVSEPVREFLLIPFGAVEVDRPIAGEGFVFTRSHAESAVRWFQELGRKLAIDYEHQSFDRLNTRADGLRPAAGWIGGLAVREDGLWAVDVTWTEKAAELLRSGEYRYFSPVIYWTDETRSAVAALGPVALTNDPAMRGVPALAARNAAAGAETETADLLSAAREEAEMLRRELVARDADAFVARGLAAGKIVISTQRDWRDDYLRDPAAAEDRLSRAPVILPTGRVTRAPGAGAGAADARRGASAAGQPAAFDSEDLAAFERATSAGRVLRAFPTD
jgi:hypothetical protein